MIRVAPLTATQAELNSDVRPLDDEAIINRSYINGRMLRTVKVEFSYKLGIVQALS